MRKGSRSLSVLSGWAVLFTLVWASGLAEAAGPFLWPLQDGQWMEFRVRPADGSDPYNDRITVGGAKTVEGGSYFGVEMPEWGRGTRETVLLRSTDNGLYRLGAEGECTVAEIDPSGDTLRCRTAAGGGDGGWEVTTLLAQAAVTVPAGAFANARLFRKHIEYDNGSVSPDWDMYIVPGVGPVRLVEYGGNYRDGQAVPGIAREIELLRLGASPKAMAEATQPAPAATDAKAGSAPAGTEEATGKVAAFGVVVEVRPSGFILKQESFNVRPGKGTVVSSVRHDLAIGYVDNLLEVLTDSAMQIRLGGGPSALSALKPGTRVVAAGMTVGGRLRALVVSDLTHIGPPPGDPSQSTLERMPSAEPPFSRPVAVQDEPLGASMCIGQHMDYNELSIAEFQGCFGGPSFNGSFSGYHFPIWYVGLDYFSLHSVTYDVALAGWRFDFPYRFSASASNLTYHAPSSVWLNVVPLKATAGELTFNGGMGFNFALDIDYTTLLGNIHVGTVNLSLLSTIHRSTGAAPLPGQTLDIDEVVCPDAGLEIPDTPIELLTLAVCEDVVLRGVPFGAGVNAKGKGPLAADYIDFDGSSKELKLTPDGVSVTIESSNFLWPPNIDIGFYVQLEFLGQVPFFTSPTIPLIHRAFRAITDPFPSPGSDMTLATDPDSPAGNPKLMPQPDLMTLTLPVNPAPTQLAVISGSALLEGEPVQGRLRETITGDPAVGETVDFLTGMPGGDPGITVSAATGTDGIARAIFPAGGYPNLSAVFGGSSLYSASATGRFPVTVTTAADLMGQWKSLAQSCRMTKKGLSCKLSGKLTIQNIGSLKAPNSVVRFYLSSDGVYDAGDTLLKQMSVASLGPKRSVTKTLSYTFPLWETANAKYVIAVIDADNKVVEYKGDNHVPFGPFTPVVYDTPTGSD